MEATTVAEVLSHLFIILPIVLVVFFVARRAGYFCLPPVQPSNPLTFLQTASIFLAYFLLAFLVVPFLNLGLMWIFDQKRLSNQWIGWMQVGALFFMFICIVLYFRILKPSLRHYIFRRSDDATSVVKSILGGFLACVLSYPFVLSTSLVTSLISLLIWNEAIVQQVAVEQLKAMMDKPILFSLMVVIVVLVVPFLEELLFRGFLQSLLDRYIGRIRSIIVTSALFSFAHFAPSQGRGNFQLISSLFVLSLFLGFIYEKERMLWAPIAMHSLFNSTTVVIMLIT